MFETRVLVGLLDVRLYDVRDPGDLRAAGGRAEHAVEVARGIHHLYLLAGVPEKAAGAAGGGGWARAPRGSRPVRRPPYGPAWAETVERTVPHGCDTPVYRLCAGRITAGDMVPVGDVTHRQARVPPRRIAVTDGK